MLYKRSPSVPWRVVDGKAVLVNVKKSEVLVLNETGTEIWSFLNQKRTIDEIAEHLYSVFDASQEDIQRDAISFVEDMLEKVLLNVS